MQKVNILTLVIRFSASIFVSGCATTEVINSYEKGAPYFFAGTRLNLAALTNDQEQLAKFESYGMNAPSHPGIDLPFSATVDAVIALPWLVTNNTTAFDGVRHSYKEAHE